MKTMKKAISLLLCCALFAAFAPAVHAEEDVLIAEASASYTIPAAGEAFSFDAVTVPDGAHYTAEIVHVYQSSLQEGNELENGFIVETGSTYFVCIRFTAESGYRIDLAETGFYVNGQSADVNADLQMPVVSFTVSVWGGLRPFLGGLDRDWIFEVLNPAITYVDKHPVLKAIVYLFGAVALPFILIATVVERIANLVDYAWERIFH